VQAAVYTSVLTMSPTRKWYTGWIMADLPALLSDINAGLLKLA